MENSQIINDADKALYNILREKVDSSIKIIFGSPADEAQSGDTDPKLFLFLYSVTENQFTKNASREIKWGTSPVSEMPPLGLDLEYMLIPSGPSVSNIGLEPPDNVASHMILAQAITALHENSFVDPKYYPNSHSPLHDSQLRIIPKTISLDDLTKLWGTFSKPYELSVCYELSVIRVKTRSDSKEVFLTEKTKINQVPVYEDEKALGIPINERVILYGQSPVMIYQIKPKRAPAGSPITIMGKNLSGDLVSVKIDEKELDSNSVVILDSRTMRVLIPNDMQKGMRKLSIYIDGTELSEYFEVLPLDKSELSLESIKPSICKAGDQEF